MTTYIHDEYFSWFFNGTTLKKFPQEFLDKHKSFVEWKNTKTHATQKLFIKKYTLPFELEMTFQKKKEKLQPIRRELDLLKQLNFHHENIVKLYGAYANSDELLIGVELMPVCMQSLHIQMGCFPELLISSIIKSIVPALIVCRSIGLNERIVKPQRILINALGIIKLGDFEPRFLPKDYSDDKDLEFMPPQAFVDYRKVKNADVWSFGYTLLECLFFTRLANTFKFDDIESRLHFLKNLNPENILLSFNRERISNNLLVFLSLCLHPDDKLRPNVKELQNSEFYLKSEPTDVEFLRTIVRHTIDCCQYKKFFDDSLIQIGQSKTRFDFQDFKEEKIIHDGYFPIKEYSHELLEKNLTIRNFYFRKGISKEENKFNYHNNLSELKKTVENIKSLVNHDNIVNVYGLFWSTNLELFVCKEVMSLSLWEMIQMNNSTDKKFNFAENFMSCLAFSMLNALKTCELFGLVDCLVKHTKVLVNYSGEIKLSVLDEETYLSHEFGTKNGFKRNRKNWAMEIMYWSPEKLRKPDLFSAVWSLGITILEACLGQFPFAHQFKFESVPIMQHCIMTLNTVEQTSRLDDCQYSQKFKQLIEMCLERVDTRKTPDELLKEFELYFPSTATESKNYVKNFLFAMNVEDLCKNV